MFEAEDNSVLVTLDKDVGTLSEVLMTNEVGMI